VRALRTALPAASVHEAEFAGQGFTPSAHAEHRVFSEAGADHHPSEQPITSPQRQRYLQWPLYVMGSPQAGQFKM
jgi:hypothetical protein